MLSRNILKLEQIVFLALHFYSQVLSCSSIVIYFQNALGQILLRQFEESKEGCLPI